jgi:LuxR family maltose regulon positive regulatory protein
MPYWYAPQMTLPKVLLAQATPDSLDQAAEVLARLLAFVTSIHNTRFHIEVLALQALLDHALGNEPRALAAVEQAVALAQPGGFVRLFVDLGPAMGDLLGKLAPRGAGSKYVQELLRAFPATHPGTQPRPAQPPTDHGDLIEPLTRRELDVLILLAERLTAGEIAQKLVVSEQTVKRHRANIYQKLGVHSRRQAVDTAVGLEIFTARPS